MFKNLKTSIFKTGGDKMDKKYSLEIYAPGSIEDIWITFESDTPFMGFNEGDIINSKMFHVCNFTA